MQRQQELHQTKKFHLPVFLKYSIECRQSSFTCGIHYQRGLRFSLLNGVFMWICHQVTFQEIVSEPQTPFCPASYLYFAAKFILRNETSTAFILETGRFPTVKFGQIRCFNLKLEHIKKSKQSEKVTLASRNTLRTLEIKTRWKLEVRAKLSRKSRPVNVGKQQFTLFKVIRFEILWFIRYKFR